MENGYTSPTMFFNSFVFPDFVCDSALMFLKMNAFSFECSRNIYLPKFYFASDKFIVEKSPRKKLFSVNER